LLENKAMTTKKILLVHGWNYANYTSSGCTDAWASRSKFVEALSRHFNVATVNLPGFCGQKDPKHPWTLDDFVQHVDQVIKKEQPNYILGYSFGGAIVLRWKKVTGDTRMKAFLVSPAILRRYRHRDLSFVRKAFKTMFPERFISLLRDFYLTQIIKNPHYANATEVMRETYRNIVSLDLREDLLDMRDSLTLIYGKNDSATPPDLVQECLKHSATHHNLHIISGGGHDIANSHTNEVVSLIMKA